MRGTESEMHRGQVKPLMLKEGTNNAGEEEYSKQIIGPSYSSSARHIFYKPMMPWTILRIPKNSISKNAVILSRLQRASQQKRQCFAIASRTRTCWLQMSNGAELQNIAMEICLFHSESQLAEDVHVR